MQNQVFLSAWNVKRESVQTLILAREYGASDKLGKKNLSFSSGSFQEQSQYFV